MVAYSSWCVEVDLLERQTAHLLHCLIDRSLSYYLIIFSLHSILHSVSKYV